MLMPGSKRPWHSLFFLPVRFSKVHPRPLASRHFAGSPAGRAESEDFFPLLLRERRIDVVMAVDAAFRRRFLAVQKIMAFLAVHGRGQLHRRSRRSRRRPNLVANRALRLDMPAMVKKDRAHGSLHINRFPGKGSGRKYQHQRHQNGKSRFHPSAHRPPPPTAGLFPEIPHDRFSCT